jgi:hypothetical protein
MAPVIAALNKARDIHHDGNVYHAPRPWSPTCVDVGDGAVYMLQYTNANGPRTEGWRPHVQMVLPVGTTSVVFAAPADDNSN